jgi:transcriptional regulator with PAS, ATPase and Fis domain
MKNRQPSINLQSIIDSQDSPTVIIDENYRIVAANASYCSSYGVRASKIVGRTCHEVSHHSPVPCHQNGEDCPHQRVFQTNSPFEVLHTHTDECNHPDRVRIKAHPLTGAEGKRYMIERIVRLAPSVDISCEEMRLVGRSPTLLTCIENLSLAAKTEAPVLIYGESGVGKELAARYVHDQSQRSSRPFIEINCAAIPESLYESELFGHERGAFTGCVGLKTGLVEQADHGTLFLDEIGEMPLPVQAKLLRFLDSGEFRRIGAKAKQRVDVRVVAATNRSLLTMVERGQFREDLYFRIAGIKVSIPPLRERREDVPMLAQVLLQRLCKRRPGPPCELTPAALKRLSDYRFPGNVRELSNVLQKAIAASHDGVIRAEHIHFDTITPGDQHEYVATPSGAQQDSAKSLDELETAHIARLLVVHGGNRRRVANVLGISERTLYRKIKLNRIEVPARAVGATEVAGISLFGFLVTDSPWLSLWSLAAPLI